MYFEWKARIKEEREQGVRNGICACKYVTPRSNYVSPVNIFVMEVFDKEQSRCALAMEFSQ